MAGEAVEDEFIDEIGHFPLQARQRGARDGGQQLFFHQPDAIAAALALGDLDIAPDLLQTRTECAVSLFEKRQGCAQFGTLGVGQGRNAHAASSSPSS